MNNLNNIETISVGQGNALIMLNHLINICEKIKCINIKSPMGLDNIIKKPILYKDFNITILPHYYAHKINIDIKLSTSTVYYFKLYYKSSLNEIRYIEKCNN